MQMTEPISCYNCHENDPTKTTVTQKFFVNSMGSDVDKVSTDSQVCGQCHNEYYFAPETKATTNPYTGLEGMTAEAILAYYDEMGFKDWEHTETGAPMLKAQHPEFETIYGGAQSPWPSRATPAPTATWPPPRPRTAPSTAPTTW